MPSTHTHAKLIPLRCVLLLACDDAGHKAQGRDFALFARDFAACSRYSKLGPPGRLLRGRDTRALRCFVKPTLLPSNHNNLVSYWIMLHEKWVRCWRRREAESFSWWAGGRCPCFIRPHRSLRPPEPQPYLASRSSFQTTTLPLHV